MATGRLGAADLAATTNTTIYTVPSSTKAALSVNVCNRGSSAVTVRLALSATGTPGDGEWIEYGVSLPAYGVLERTGIMLAATQRVVAYASAATVAVVAWGVEEAA